MEDEHKRSGMMTRDEWMAWLRESWAEAQARAHTPEQKPVAYITGFNNGHCVIQPTDPALVLPVGTALYTAPQKKEWVGLTDDEISYQARKEDHAVYFALGALWAEAKLREKNI
jgi:hypothetical protein